jgi:CubicO group peptidase (beta-lactamase class C family)
MRKLLLWLLLVSGAALLRQPGFAQSSETTLQTLQRMQPVVDSLFAGYARLHHLPGISWGIVYQGQVLMTGSYGYANLQQQLKADTGMAFRIASMSKSFTAMAILQLRDQGKLSLDAPAYTYVPEMRHWKMLTADAEPIKVKDLLTHNAGFPEDNPWGDRQLALPEKAFRQFLEKGVSFSHSPEEAYEYSNLGFAVLGQIITNVSGEKYQDYITRHILQPLGMHHTYWEYSNVPASRLAHGYRWLDTAWVEQPMLHDGAYGAMGGLITTMSDFVKYMNFHLQATPPRDEADKGPLKRSSVREMQKPWNFSGFDPYFTYTNGRLSPTVSQYAYGLRWMEDGEERVFIGHTGGLPGFGSHWYIMPQYGLGIASFGNGTYAPMSRIDVRVLDTLILAANLQKYTPPPSAILLKRQQELMTFLPGWKNAVSSPVFAENFFLDNLIEPLTQQTRAAFEAIGTVKEVKTIVPENNLRGSFEVTGSKGQLIIKFTLSPEADPKIQAFSIARKKE